MEHQHDRPAVWGRGLCSADRRDGPRPGEFGRSHKRASRFAAGCASITRRRPPSRPPPQPHGGNLERESCRGSTWNCAYSGCRAGGGFGRGYPYRWLLQRQTSDSGDRLQDVDGECHRDGGQCSEAAAFAAGRTFLRRCSSMSLWTGRRRSAPRLRM